MSKWHEKLDEIKQSQEWKNLIDFASSTEIDQKIEAQKIEEALRFKKALIFLDNLLDGIDPELLPFDDLQIFFRETHRLSSTVNRPFRNLDFAEPNKTIDDLLSKLNTLAVSNNDRIKASSRMMNNLTKIQNKNFVEAERQKKIIFSLKKDLSDIEDNISLIQTNVETSQSLLKKITDFHNYLFMDDSDGISSISSRIRRIDEEASKLFDELSTRFSETKQRSDQLKSFFDEVFGDNSKGEIGRKEELDNFIQQLHSVHEEQTIAYEELFKRIEGLLPGAASAGLSVAFNKQKKRASLASSSYTICFVVTIICIVFFASLYEPFNPETWHLEISIRTAIFGSLISLAYFFSKRRNEYHRLEQEYAHKEAVSQSYSGLKQELNNLGEQSKMLDELIKTCIKSLSFNPAAALDKKNGDSHFAIETFDKIIKRWEKQKNTTSWKND